AAPGQKPIDEAPRAGALDELDLEMSDREVGPGELRPLAVSSLLRLVRFCRKVLEKEIECPIDRADGDRDVVDAQTGSARRDRPANASSVAYCISFGCAQRARSVRRS